MTRPAISVVTTTYRPWDRLLGQLADLKAQVFRDFEWVVVDDLAGRRPFVLEADFPITYLVPRNGQVTYFAPAHADNTALLHCRGRLVYWMNDYIRLTPTVLERHWDIYKGYGPRVVISGPLVPMDKQMEFPPRHFDVPLERLLSECVCGKGVWQYSAGRNDSAPLKELLALNGLDESFDGDRGGSDVDLAMRLVMDGCRYVVDMKAICFEYAHHADSNPKYPWEKELPKKGSWNRMVQSYRPSRLRAANNWDIARERETLIGSAA